ncbi:ParA family protein [Clostridium sp. DL1XJH146]
MKIISIINYKGGVGKTTITANLATQLAKNKKKVLAIDLDPQSNLTFSFLKIDTWQELYEPKQTIKTWFNDCIDDNQNPSLSKLIISPNEVNKHVNNNLDLISSHLGLINIDLELAVMLGGASERQQRNNFLKVHSLLNRGIKSLENTYDYILIDCPPNFNIVTKNALIASDFFLVPSKPDYLSTLGIEQLNKHTNTLLNIYNKYASFNDNNYEKINPKFLGVIFNMVNIKNNNLISSQKNYFDQIKSTSIPLFNNMIRESNSLFGSAPSTQLPVILNKSHNKTSKTVNKELVDFTCEFVNKVGTL